VGETTLDVAAEGATAPETLRHTYCRKMRLWREIGQASSRSTEGKPEGGHARTGNISGTIDRGGIVQHTAFAV